MFHTLKDKITTSQLAMTVASYSIATGILTLPRNITKETGNPDGWLSIILVELVIVGGAFLIITLCKRFPQKTFYQFSQDILGKGIGWLLGMVMTLFLLFVSGFEVRAMSEVTKLHLLPLTPLYATAIPFICLGIYLTVSGINTTARVIEILLPLTILIFVVVLALSLKTFNIDQVRPVMGNGIGPVLRGAKASFLSVTGVEIILILFPFMKNKQRAMKAALVGIAIPGLLSVVTMIFTVGSMGIQGVMMKTWPTISLFRGFELTGIIFERFETFFLAVWILQIFTTYVVSYLLAAYGFAQLLNKSYQSFIYGIAPFTYLIAMAPRDVNVLFQMGNLIGLLGFCFSILIPSLLLLVAIIRRKKDEAPL